jgi:hypothetical protein
MPTTTTFTASCWSDCRICDEKTDPTELTATGLSVGKLIELLACCSLTENDDASICRHPLSSRCFAIDGRLIQFRPRKIKLYTVYTPTQRNQLTVQKSEKSTHWEKYYASLSDRLRLFDQIVATADPNWRNVSELGQTFAVMRSRYDSEMETASKWSAKELYEHCFAWDRFFGDIVRRYFGNQVEAAAKKLDAVTTSQQSDNDDVSMEDADNPLADISWSVLTEDNGVSVPDNLLWENDRDEEDTDYRIGRPHASSTTLIPIDSSTVPRLGSSPNRSPSRAVSPSPAASTRKQFTPVRPAIATLFQSDTERGSIVKTLRDFWYSNSSSVNSTLLGGDAAFFIELAGLKPLEYPLYVLCFTLKLK